MNTERQTAIARTFVNELVPFLREFLPDLVAAGLEQQREPMVEATALRVVERLREQGEREGLIDASEVGRRLGRSRAWVYGHAAELDAVRLGNGSRPRLAFHPERITEYLNARSPGEGSQPGESRADERRAPSRRRHRSGSLPGLLPIRGEPPCP